MTEATIEFEQLEEAIKALNDSGIVEEKIEYSLEEEGFDLDELLAQFMRVTESIPFEKEKEAPDIVVNLYNEVADKVMTAKAESECEMYGIGWDSKLSECKQCQKDYPDEYKKCKELSQAQGESVTKGKTNNQQLREEKMTKKKEKVVETKEQPAEVEEVENVKEEENSSDKVANTKVQKKEQSRFGHRIDSIGGKLDSLLSTGSSLDDMCVKLNVGKGRVRSHMKHLRQDRGIEISEEKGGIIKVVGK